ncbi:putative outer membrane starch-binding protein [Gelidibacter algens]|uniref:Putative outer membrane starch-binding protein n=1 Tax=Gelidibacter algens TaxID=49280 RepID=A0A1A7R349_9FLAO|nr:RagB/SusD family nutrient uptake outer membrane protein [Gelidibacter algens]OBX25192.1 hypothetical protein A9996_11280 [Gelidibacter algens]RAJ22511.1 putative outer membrane starch-binding protein [Gelidibacter algens]
MKNYNFNLRVLFVVLGASFVSCNDVLDEVPDNRASINTEEDITRLLTAAYPEAAYVSFVQPMSDIATDKGPDARNQRLNEEMYFWRDLNDIDSDTPTNYWNSAYEAISQANQALQSIDELGGGDKFNAQRGEALVSRAYAHFMLVSIFAKAYNPETAASTLGVPYVTEPETVLLPKYTRASIEEVYTNIEKDLTEGLPLILDNYDVPSYHFNKKAANAFAARFYLNKGEWQKVIDHSTVALGSGGASALRIINTQAYQNLTYSELSNGYISSSEPSNLLLVAGSSTYARDFATLRYHLGASVSNSLFPGDNGTGSPWAYSLFGGELFANVPKFVEYFRVTNQAAGIGFPFATFVLFNADEALLNRAEAYAMLGQYESALADINLSFSVKTEDYAPRNVLSDAELRNEFAVNDNSLYTPFYTISEEALPYINAVLDMKKTIFFDEGLRWFDIKRHNIVVVHNDFFGNTFTLPKDDLRRALQIPSDAQSFGIEPNPR